MNSTNIGVITNRENVDIATQALSECLKSTAKFWETIYTNVCSGEVYSVANGFWDLAGYLLLAGIGLGLVLFLFGTLFIMVVAYLQD